MSGSTNRRKGHNFERDTVNVAKELGYEAKRILQYQAGHNSPDVLAAANSNLLAIECKNTATLPGAALLKAWEQAQAQAIDGHVPMVVIKLRGTSKSLAVMDFETVLKLLKVA